MRRTISLALAISISCFAIPGCAEHETATSKSEVKTPGGTTTVTTKKDVEKTGDHKDK